MLQIAGFLNVFDQKLVILDFDKSNNNKDIFFHAVKNLNKKISNKQQQILSSNKIMCE